MKNVNLNFLNIMLYYYFSLEAVLLSQLKKIQPKNKSMLKFRRHWSIRPEWKLTEECKIYRYKIAKIDLTYKLQLTCIRISEAVTSHCSVKKVLIKILQNLCENIYVRDSFSLGLSSAMLLFVSLKYLSQETSTYSNLATESLKQDVKSIKS